MRGNGKEKERRMAKIRRKNVIKRLFLFVKCTDALMYKCTDVLRYLLLTITVIQNKSSENAYFSDNDISG